MVRGKSPTEEDIERWAELINETGIKDIDDFENVWNKFFNEDAHIRTDDSLKTRTFNRLRVLNSNIEAVRKPVKIKRIRKGSKQQVKTQMVIKERPKPRKLKITGKVRGKIVKAERTFVTVRGKAQLRFRDKKGRFVKVKRK